MKRRSQNWLGAIASSLLVLSILCDLTAAQAGSPDRLEDRVIAVDRIQLLQRFAAGAQALGTVPAQRGIGVVEAFQRADSAGDFELLVGIYEDEGKAVEAFGKSMASAIRKPKTTLADDCFFSGSACHMRVQNAVVIYFHGKPIPREDEESLAVELYNALTHTQVTRYGRSVRLPKVEVVHLDDTVSPPLLVYRTNEEDLIHVGSAKKSTEGLYELRVNRAFFDSELIVRFMRTTGEVLPFRLRDVPASKRGPRPASASGLAPAVRNELIQKLKSGSGNAAEQQGWILKLVEAPDESLAPFFQELLDSERAVSVRRHALKGIAKLRKVNALDQYRRISSDVSEAELLRREGIRLLRQHGNKDDLPLLRTILAEGNQVLGREAQRAIRALEAR